MAAALQGPVRKLILRSVAATSVALAMSPASALAGGLTPENVRDAIGFLAPDIVDVSSGVEISPGVKDPAKMKAFAEAVRSASIVEREIPPPLKVE